MNLYLLRHGIAAEPSDWQGADSDRPLTDEGIHKMEKAAEGMRAFGLEFDAILTSPYRRAFETAKIVAEEFEMTKSVRVLKTLAVEGDIKALIRHVALNFRSWESILLVGHEPMMSHLVSLLSSDGHLSLGFKKGALCKLSAHSLAPSACANLEWLMTSKAFREMA